MAEDILDWLMDHIVPWFIVLMFVFFVLVLVVILVGHFIEGRRPEFSLKKDDWSCTQVHNYTTTTYVMAGKVLIPQIMTHNDCIQWSHK